MRVWSIKRSARPAIGMLHAQDADTALKAIEVTLPRTTKLRDAAGFHLRALESKSRRNDPGDRKQLYNVRGKRVPSAASRPPGHLHQAEPGSILELEFRRSR